MQKCSRIWNDSSSAEEPYLMSRTSTVSYTSLFSTAATCCTRSYNSQDPAVETSSCFFLLTLQGADLNCGSFNNTGAAFPCADGTTIRPNASTILGANQTVCCVSVVVIFHDSSPYLISKPVLVTCPAILEACVVCMIHCKQ